MMATSPGASEMEASQDGRLAENSDGSTSHIDQLPNEILEYIFKLISPYTDYLACYRVSRRWREICIQVCRTRLTNFNHQVSQGELRWASINADDAPGGVSKRYSHCAVYQAASHSMFIFGGCTSTSSTFNDLLQFNLNTRTWSRPRAIGTYPSPKALATLVETGSGSQLILFGGWTHPSVYPLHQTWKLFNELHFFDVTENRWSQIIGEAGASWPPPTAGHSATVHREKLVVFGGLQKQRDVGFFNSSNNIWVFNIALKAWCLQPVEGESVPTGRYGQSQIYLDEFHLVILGGCVGTNNVELTDVWLLEMRDTGWRWHELKTEGMENRGKDIWRHPACKASEDKIVVLGKSKVNAKNPSQVGKQKVGSVPAPHHVTRNAIGSVALRSSGYSTSSSSEENEPSDAAGASGGRYRSNSGEVDGARGGAGPSTLSQQQQQQQRSDGGGLDPELTRSAAANKPPRQKMMENRQRQLASLNRMEERIRNSARIPSSAAAAKVGAAGTSPPVLCPNHRMALSVLDISKALSDHVVTWLPPSPLPPGSEVPQECILYSLVRGRTELIMFGGLMKDISLGGQLRDLSQASVSNTVNILYPHLDRI